MKSLPFLLLMSLSFILYAQFDINILITYMENLYLRNMGSGEGTILEDRNYIPGSLF
jgi:hypothetical protein